MKKQISLTSAMGTLKRPSAVTRAILRYPPQETVMVTLNLHSCASIKVVSQVSMIKSYFTTGIALRLALRASVSQTLADPRSYAKGQTTTEIVESIKELYDVDISSSLVSRVTDNILDDITAWQNRPLSSVYPIVYLDCIVVKSWRNNWEGLTVFFEYPKDIRKAIYTTNAIESLNSVIRTAVNKRKVFPSDQAAFKVVYLATQQASKKWSMPIRNWTSALNRFMIMFDDRISKHLI